MAETNKTLETNYPSIKKETNYYYENPIDLSDTQLEGIRVKLPTT